MRAVFGHATRQANPLADANDVCVEIHSPQYADRISLNSPKIAVISTDGKTDVWVSPTHFGDDTFDFRRRTHIEKTPEGVMRQSS
jgi:hypothetical protein